MTPEEVGEDELAKREVAATRLKEIGEAECAGCSLANERLTKQESVT